MVVSDTGGHSCGAAARRMSSWAALKARAGALAPSMSKAGEDERNGDDERKPLNLHIEGGSETGIHHKAGHAVALRCDRRAAA